MFFIFYAHKIMFRSDDILYLINKLTFMHNFRLKNLKLKYLINDIAIDLESF